MSLVVIVDYGMGNLHSIAKALQQVAPARTFSVTADPAAINTAERVVLPGVGAIGDCMRHLRELNLVEVLRKAAQQKPFLGICLGMQALFSHSTENNGVDGLDLLPGTVQRFPTSTLKVPHMGWNEVQQTQAHPLWTDIPDNSRFYFVHSYYAPVTLACAGQTHYGLPFAAAVAQGKLFATQFHPEKSQHAGLQLLRNFIHWQP